MEKELIKPNEAPDDIDKVLSSSFSALAEYYVKTGKISELLKLNEKLKEAEFKRRVQLREQELEDAAMKEKFFVDRISLTFKLIVAIAAFIVGTYLASHGQEEIGFFLLGSGIGATGLNAVDLMKASRR